MGGIVVELNKLLEVVSFHFIYSLSSFYKSFDIYSIVLINVCACSKLLNFIQSEFGQGFFNCQTALCALEIFVNCGNYLDIGKRPNFNCATCRYSKPQPEQIPTTCHYSPVASKNLPANVKKFTCRRFLYRRSNCRYLLYR